MLKNIWKKIVKWIIDDVPKEIESCEFCDCHKANGCSEEEKDSCEQLKIENNSEI